jgi:hypothetical protein
LYWNWTPATPTLSEASAVTVIVPETVAPDAGDVILAVGGMVSPGGHVKPGIHGNCANAFGGTQAKLKISSRTAAHACLLMVGIDLSCSRIRVRRQAPDVVRFRAC